MQGRAQGWRCACKKRCTIWLAMLAFLLETDMAAAKKAKKKLPKGFVPFGRKGKK